MADRLGVPVRARCACGTTWVFLGWPRRPCGRCREHVVIELTEEAGDE